MSSYSCSVELLDRCCFYSHCISKHQIIFRGGRKAKAARKCWVNMKNNHFYKRKIKSILKRSNGDNKENWNYGVDKRRGERAPRPPLYWLATVPTLESPPWLVLVRWRFLHRKRSCAVIGRGSCPLAMFVKTHSSPTAAGRRPACLLPGELVTPGPRSRFHGAGGECL